MRALHRSGWIFLLLVACLPTGPSTRDDFLRNRQRWEERRPAAYEFVFQRSSCECLPERTIPMQVTVREGRIDSVVELQTGEPISAETHGALRIDDLFALIQQAIDQGAYRISVSYDRDLGYPTSIVLDHDAQIADDEIEFSSRELRAVD